MDMLSARDAAVTALILGFFATSWFGWAQERPPPHWRPRLIAGTVVAAAVAFGGAVLAVQHWSGVSALHEGEAGRSYGIIVGVEVVACGLGAAVLAARGRGRFICPWIAFVVGLHFLPMAPVLADPWLVVLGVVLMSVAAAGALADRWDREPSALTGALTGTALLVAAAGTSSPPSLSDLRPADDHRRAAAHPAPSDPGRRPSA